MYKRQVIKKANSICPESIALIGVYGSFYTGDIHDKSDLDLCIVINDDEGWKLSSCFILDDVAFDIYCTPWDVQMCIRDSSRGLSEPSSFNNLF